LKRNPVFEVAASIQASEIQELRGDVKSLIIQGTELRVMLGEHVKWSLERSGEMDRLVLRVEKIEQKQAAREAVSVYLSSVLHRLKWWITLAVGIAGTVATVLTLLRH
jgi:hypothetical protein